MLLSFASEQGDDVAVYTALVKRGNTDDHEMHLDASAAKFGDNSEHLSQDSGRRPTYENVSKMSSVYMNG